MNEASCSCRRWMLTGIPCCHAVTCCNDKKINPEELIPEYYQKEAYINCYEPIIFPANGPNLWDNTSYPDILPPPIRRAPGRPKKSRRKDADEKARDSTQLTRKGIYGKCTRCKQIGHNKKTCPLPPPPTTATTEPTAPPPTATTESTIATTQASQTPSVAHSGPLNKKGRPKKTQPTTSSATHSGSSAVAHSGSSAVAHQTAATQPRRSPRGLSKGKGSGTAPTLGLRRKLPIKRNPWK